MSILVRIYHHSVQRPILTLAVLFAFLAVGTVSHSVRAADDAVRAKVHVITIYDGKEEIGLLSKKPTLGAALKEAGITIGKNDAIEPSLDHPLIASSYDVNVYRARPVLIVDGDVTLKVMTSYRAARQIATKAGLEIRAEDEVRLTHSVDTLERGAIEQVVVKRATQFTFDLYGKEVPAYTMEKTVGAMLAKKGVTLGEKDGVEPALTTPVAAGMKIRVWRDGKQTITVEETVAKPIEEVKDMDKEIGFREIRTPGEDGKKQVTYEIELRNGKEIARKETNSIVTKQPVKEVVTVGGKPKAPPAYTGGGSKDDWLRASGIPQDQWQYVDFIVRRESGWNPNARNPSSGACGLAQSLPCGKQKVYGEWNDPVANLKWQYDYVRARYGGYSQAYAFWQKNHWY